MTDTVLSESVLVVTVKVHLLLISDLIVKVEASENGIKGAMPPPLGVQWLMKNG